MGGSSSVPKEEKWIKHYSNFQKILLAGEGDFSFSVSLANAFGSASNMVATSLDSEGIKLQLEKMGGSSSVAKEEKWIKHYSNFQNILLVGEGDFSFALSLANAFGSATNIVATSLDSKGKVKEKYSKGEMNLEELKEKGCTIIHGVDAHTMSNHPKLLDLSPFDRIVFNYPHARIQDTIHESSPSQIKIHQKLVRGLLTNACEILSEDGEVHVTHKTTHPFTEWGIQNIAIEVGLQLVEEDEFDKWDYPGYHNRKGYGRCNRLFPVGQSSTFKFAL